MSIISIDNEKIANSEVLQILRKTGQIPMLVKNLILEKELSKIHLGAELENQLTDDFRKERKLLDDESFLDYMVSRHLDEELLKQMLSRPELIIRYREERWGPDHKAFTSNIRIATTQSIIADRNVRAPTSCRKCFSPQGQRRKLGKFK